jgi:hypothetical protein
MVRFNIIDYFFIVHILYMSELSKSTSYNLYISSSDKVSGNNRDGVFQVNWDDFLPREYSAYTTTFSFQSTGGAFKDTAATFTASIASTGIMTLSAFTVGGWIPTGSPSLFGTGVPSGTVITGMLSGTLGGGVANTYQTNCYKLVAGTTMTSNLNFCAGKVILYTQGTSLSFDTTSKSVGNTLGYIQRNVQSSTVSCFSCSNVQSAPKTISRPNQNMVKIVINNINSENLFLSDTNSLGNTLFEMTPWNMIITFYPVMTSRNKIQSI